MFDSSIAAADPHAAPLEASHTPGPWVLHPRLALVGDLDSKEGQRRVYCATVSPAYDGNYRGNICDLQDCAHIDGIDRHETRANATLISAAPDLLAALKELTERASFEAGCVNPNGAFWDALEQARAAIAKAEAR